MEAVCDNNLWFWHCFFGSGGAFNDLNILDSSNLLEMMLNNVLEALEKDSGTVPFEVGGELFDKLFLLVDGIYPDYTRFAKGIKDPIRGVLFGFPY